MLRHGILGLIAYGDMTGYEISEVFRDSLAYFWSAKTSQIYREIEKLESLGFITRRTVEQTGAPNKNVCSITDAGREELCAWLASPHIDGDLHSGMLMKIFFLGHAGKSASAAHFDAIAAAHERALAAMDSADSAIAHYADAVPDLASAVYWKMTADFGRRYMRMVADWARDCRAELSEGDDA